MARIGRPTRLVAEQRRRAIARLIARWAHEDSGTVKRLSDELHVGERAIRADLEQLATEEQAVLRVPDDLTGAIARVKTPDDLADVERRLIVEAAAGRVSPEGADFHMNALRELRQTLKRAKRQAAPADGFDLVAAMDEYEEHVRKWQTKRSASTTQSES